MNEAAPIRWPRLLRAYGLAILFWMPLAALLSWQEYRIGSEEHLNLSVASVVLLAGVRFFTIALLTPPVFWIVERFPISTGKVVRRMACYLAGFVPFALLFALIRWLLLPPFYPATQQWGKRSLSALAGLTYTSFADELLVYLAVVVAAHAVFYFKRLQRQQLEESALREALTQSELQTLQAQVQPHFLFNTLNGISSLLHSDPARAEQIILRLSSLLRRTLQQDGSDLVRLDDDLRLTEDYLDIESMRLGSRMAVRWEIAPETRGLLVPQFMFQQLVENGVKHGIANCRGQGWIEIASRRGEHTLSLEVRNSVNGEPVQGTGVGHQNIRTRLTLLYGAEAALEFARKDRVAEARLVLPALPGNSTEKEAAPVQALTPEMRT